MSLVSEALRKARQEAALRDAERRGTAPPAWAGPARTGRPAAALVLGAIIGLVAALAGAAMVWWLLSDEDASRSTAQLEIPAAAPTQSERPPASGQLSLAPAAQGPAAGSDPGADPIEDSSAGPASAEPQPPPFNQSIGNETGASDQISRSAADEGLPEPGGSPEADRERHPASTADADQALEAEEPLVFDLEAELGEVTLSLDYLVLRSNSPFAEINGQEVHLGATVDGYELIEIERDRVVLEGPLGRVTIRIP